LNHLAGSTSPYLQQHASNPVDWYPWGPQALALARSEDKPILLSIGYAACHWCHVMAHESFEDPETARLINERFVAIKVDREERPDLDAIYMKAVQAITGSGGWPMTVFLTPDTHPYYGGTYFPPQDGNGLPSFRRVLIAASDAYRGRRSDVMGAVGQIGDALRPPLSDSADLTHVLLDGATSALVGEFDAGTGGFGGAPKFPQAMALEFMLPTKPSVVERSLEAMARGGIYDQLGGGFHRYSVDARWLVPHFEKMLYDNALLSGLYLHAYQATRRPLYRRIVEETLDYVVREMTGPDGGSYTSQDADSEGVEGKYYVWQWDELAELGVADYYGATPGGNFEGKNILSVPAGLMDELPDEVTEGRRLLFARRQERVPPRTDEKALASWNGLMLRSLAEAGVSLGRADYLEEATRAAGWLLSSLRRSDGRLLRSAGADIPGFLEDHAALGLGLLSLYEATGGERWLRESVSLADAAVELFWDEASGVFFDTGSDAEPLIVRPREVQDNAVPSGNSLICELLLRLAALLGHDVYRTRGEAVLRANLALAERYPLAFGRLLTAAAFAAADPVEISIVGAPGDRSTRALLESAQSVYLPYRIIAVGGSTNVEAPLSPLLADRVSVGGTPAAYVCRRRVCLPPVSDAGSLARVLAAERD
jgi:uncharacterized protein YyaL (SSP411 family)